jgi:PBP1b-binding outer membrane lipoprotein LpoB
VRHPAILIALFLSGCVEEPTPKEAEAAAEMQADITPQKQLEDEARSIEQAADAAVKLIEEEAKAETDRSSAEAE